MSQWHIFNELYQRWVAPLGLFARRYNSLNVPKCPLNFLMNGTPICRFGDLPSIWVFSDLLLRWLTASVTCPFSDLLLYQFTLWLSLGPSLFLDSNFFPNGWFLILITHFCHFKKKLKKKIEKKINAHFFTFYPTVRRNKIQHNTYL